MGIGTGILDWDVEFGLRTRIRDWDWGSGLRIRLGIGIRDLGLGSNLVDILKITFELEVYLISCGDAGLVRK